MKTYPLEWGGRIFLYSGMFLRRICRKKDGKSHHYWVLVESYRTARGPRQRQIAYLGEMDAAGRLGVQQAVQNHPGHQMTLLEATKAEWIEINVNAVRTERSRRFGDVWLALALLKKLQLDQFFQKTLTSAHVKISLAHLATILVTARFCAPKSELHIAEHFYSQTALADLLGIPAHAIYDNRLYRALDKVLLQKAPLEKHLKERLGELFQINYDLFLYDITSTYFEGAAEKNSQAQRGHSRDHRADCKQVLIALVVTKEGIPLGYEVFAGNKHDCKTVATIVQQMEARYGQAERIWIMDRGMNSPETLKLLGEEQRRYILGTPKSLLKKFEAELAATDTWEKIRDGLEVKRCSSPFGQAHEIFLLCRSTDRQAKEKAIRERFVKRIETALGSLQKSCASGRLASVEQTERHLGRLLERNRRGAKFFIIEVKEQNGTVQLNWSKREKQLTWANVSDGCYVLRSNIKDWTASELWKAYIQLTEAEEAFRIHKNDLELRPVWHQKENRVQAHILVCFLAYVLWKCFGQMCKQAGLGDEPRKVIQEIKKLQLTDVVLPTRNGVDIRLRCVSTPEPDLAMLLQKLKLKPPARLTPNLNL